jgi:hypothetical protein
LHWWRFRAHGESHGGHDREEDWENSQMSSQSHPQSFNVHRV